jgi:hypothetical protein
MTTSCLYRFIIILYLLIHTTSCKQTEVEYDCGEVDTAITAINHEIGSYVFDDFISTQSTNYEEAAIELEVENFTITSTTETSCFSFISVPQVIDSISISSTSSVSIANVVYNSGDELNALFKIHSRGQTFDTVLEFIEEHKENPTIFSVQSDRIVLQLLSKPTAEINQEITIVISFDDLTSYTIEVPSFQVSI